MQASLLSHALALVALLEPLERHEWLWRGAADPGARADAGAPSLPAGATSTSWLLISAVPRRRPGLPGPAIVREHPRRPALPPCSRDPPPRLVSANDGGESMATLSPRRPQRLFSKTVRSDRANVAVKRRSSWQKNSARKPRCR
jgi:hypothetical protein